MAVYDHCYGKNVVIQNFANHQHTGVQCLALNTFRDADLISTHLSPDFVLHRTILGIEPYVTVLRNVSLHYLKRYLTVR